MQVHVRFLKTDPLAKLPRYESNGASGADLRARLDQPVIIPPMGRLLIPTGLKMEIPPDFEAQVRPRSGLALKHGITVLNSPGTIDSDYRGEIGIILINLSQAPFTVNDGDRIAQLVIAPVAKASFDEVSALEESNRGTGGFGSTGV